MYNGKYSYVGQENNIVYERFLDIMNEFNNQIDIHNFLLNEKIKKKLNIINFLLWNRFSILNYDVSTSIKLIRQLEKISNNKQIIIPTWPQISFHIHLKFNFNLWTFFEKKF